MQKIHLIGFLIFLVLYSAFKYQAVPSLMGQPSYIISTAILVVLTAIVPYTISLFALRGRSGRASWVLAAGLPLVLCTLGLATYFYVFIRPSIPDLSVYAVLPRAVTPGLIMAGLLIVRAYFVTRSEPTTGAPA